jgi:hypothetical protein
MRKEILRHLKPCTELLKMAVDKGFLGFFVFNGFHR